MRNATCRCLDGSGSIRLNAFRWQRPRSFWPFQRGKRQRIGAAGRSLFSNWSAYAVAFLVSLIIFIQLRACDEYKDGPDDRRYRPERPIPRGLVSLRLILGIGAGLVPVAVLLTWFYNRRCSFCWCLSGCGWH